MAYMPIGPKTRAFSVPTIQATSDDPATAVGPAAQTVATTKYSVGTAIATNGCRYVAVLVKCNTNFTLYGWGKSTSFASAGGNSPTTGMEISSATVTGAAATSADGRVYYMRCAGNAYFLPLLYQASGGSATVTLAAVPYD